MATIPINREAWKCKNCLYFDKFPDPSGAGWCVVRPPSAARGGVADYAAVFPLVEPNMKCGEFEKR